MQQLSIHILERGSPDLAQAYSAFKMVSTIPEF